MENLIQRAALISLIVILSGCIQYSLVKAGTVEEQGISFSTSEAWSKSPFNMGKYTTVMTRDGEGLNQLILIHGVPEGKEIFRKINKDTPPPKFSSSLAPHEIEGFITSSLINASGEPFTINTSNIKPIELDGNLAISFDMEYFAPSGLLIKGKSVGAIKDGQFYAMIVTASKLHYYDLYKSDYQNIISSFRI